MVFETLLFGVADATVLLNGAIGAYALVPGECSTAEGARAADTGGAATAVDMVGCNGVERCWRSRGSVWRAVK